MHMFIGPDGNPEIWKEKPDGYYTVEEWQEMHPVPAPAPPSSEQLLDMLRTARDVRLAATDKYLLADYPISAENLTEVRAYRQALRELPVQDGAPWDGGGELTPWPELPSVG